MKKERSSWKLVGRVALAMAIAGVTTYILSRKKKSNAKEKSKTK